VPTLAQLTRIWRRDLIPDRDISDPQLAKALAHPLRVAILAELEERTASPSDVAEALDAPLGSVSYHVRCLHRFGLLELVKTRPVRGAIEHLYRAKERPVITSDAWAQAPTIVKQATIRASLAQVAGLVNRAARAGGFERPNSHLSRSPVVVDAEGWNELAARFDQLLKDCEQIAAASAKRIASADHDEEISAAAVLMLFETTPAAGAAKPTERARGRRKRAAEQVISAAAR
jgi:DNA-binding transcriptional ArsR family regulator